MLHLIRGDLMLAYNKLNEQIKNIIVETYYTEKQLEFKDISTKLDVSERAVARVLKEKGINTRLKNRYTLNENYFNSIDTEIKAYILGLLYADGYVGDENFNNISISLKEEDAELIHRIAKEIDFSGTVRISDRKGGYENGQRTVVLNFSSSIMANDLRKLGLYPNKSTTMEDLPVIDEKLYRHFIRGYFDGDGSITISETTSYYKSETITKVYKYPQYVCTMIGTDKFIKNIIAKINLQKYSVRPSKSDNMIYLRVEAKQELMNLFEYMYNDSTMYMNRKFNKWVKIIGALNKELLS